MARTPGQAADRVAAEVEARIERLATLAADAILHSIYAPEVVNPTKDQSLDYWRPFFFTPDGYVNQEGRDQVRKQVGGPEYKRIAQDLAAELRRQGRESLEQAPAELTGTEIPPVPTEPVAPATPLEQAVPPLYGPRTQPAAPPIAV